jgi:hypothetical protein
MGTSCDSSILTFFGRYKGDLKVHAARKHKQLANLPEQISRPRSSRESKPFGCPISSCNCGYERHRDLLRHIRTKHMEICNDYRARARVDSAGEESSSTHALIAMLKETQSYCLFGICAAVANVADVRFS